MGVKPPSPTHPLFLGSLSVVGSIRFSWKNGWLKLGSLKRILEMTLRMAIQRELQDPKEKIGEPLMSISSEPHGLSSSLLECRPLFTPGHSTRAQDQRHLLAPVEEFPSHDPSAEVGLRLGFGRLKPMF